MYPRPARPAALRLPFCIFLIGFATFAQLYAPQPLLPAISAHFHLTPAAASGMISAATTTLALVLIPFGLLSDRLGRRRLLLASLAMASLSSLLMLAAEEYWHALTLRMLTGIAIGGVQVTALAFLAEQTTGSGSLARAISLYAAGNALGGVTGRMLALVIGTEGHWQWAVAAFGCMGLLTALYLHRALPRETGFTPSTGNLASAARALFGHLRDRRLQRLLVMGFLLMGTYTSLYNYILYPLLAPPFHLAPWQTSGIFLFLLLGPPVSLFSARLLRTYTQRVVLCAACLALGSGLGLLSISSIEAFTAGLAVFTFGYFMAYTTLSVMVSLQGNTARGVVNSLYLSAFYAGASVVGTITGSVFAWGGWGMLVCLLLFTVALMFIAAVWNRSR